MITMIEILARLNEIFQDVFLDDELTISPETSAKDIEDWDSVSHVTMIITVEKAFGVRFSSREVAGLNNVGELAALIEAKVKS